MVHTVSSATYQRNQTQTGTNVQCLSSTITAMVPQDNVLDKDGVDTELMSDINIQTVFDLDERYS